MALLEKRICRMKFAAQLQRGSQPSSSYNAAARRNNGAKTHSEASNLRLLFGHMSWNFNGEMMCGHETNQRSTRHTSALHRLLSIIGLLSILASIWRSIWKQLPREKTHQQRIKLVANWLCVGGVCSKLAWKAEKSENISAPDLESLQFYKKVVPSVGLSKC